MIRKLIVSMLVFTMVAGAQAQTMSAQEAREAAVLELTNELKKLSAEERAQLVDSSVAALETLKLQIKETETALKEAKSQAKKAGEKYAPVRIPTMVLALGGLIVAGYGGDHLLGRAKMVVNEWGKPIPKIGKAGSFGFIGAGLLMMGAAFYTANAPRNEVVVAVEKVDEIDLTLSALYMRAEFEIELLKILKSIG